ncbi:RNA-dependent DNA polymerase [Phytophthora megakarya]|uniref:RNA-dependent DNA polymerase n=1 Tax=Phytophthora megakarya TaxID=4795 RepID=A0A225VY42_9STRA|nr:RNA-dependent DNA polymerase [Phytophthora megakarya]
MDVKTHHDLHTVRALTSYFRRYIPGFAAFAASLERFKQKDVASRWDGDCDTWFLQVDGRNRPIAYASKLLTGSQCNGVDKTSGTTEIDCWGIIWAMHKFSCYLDHNEFDLHTDHQALTWIFSENARTTNAKLVRWAMELSQLRFKFHHKPGTSM